MGKTRIYLAALLAAAVPALLFALVFVALAEGGPKTVVLVILFVLSVSSAHVLFVGFPLFLALRRLNRVGGWALAVGGFIAGALPYSVLTWLFKSTWDASDLLWALIMSALGSVGGLTAWLAMRGTEPSAR